jgi:hypothetical protein
MTRYAVPLHDLDNVWRTPAGAALIDAALDGREAADVVTVESGEAVVLDGTDADVAALVAGLLRTRLPAADGRHVRVYARHEGAWRRVSAPPAVPDLPDEAAEFEDSDAEEALALA